MSYEKNTKPTVLTFPCGLYASAFWRLYWPTLHLEMLGEIDLNSSSTLLRDSLTYKSADVIQLQRVTDASTASFLQKLAGFKKEFGFRMIYDVDDVLVREDMADFHKAECRPLEYDVDAMELIFSLCDEITVSTPFLKEYYQKKFSQNNVTVIPNKLPFFWAGNYYNEAGILSNYRRHKSRPRILYAGSFAHVNAYGKKGNDDFTHVIDAIKKTSKEFKWVFFGVLPLELGAENDAGDVECHRVETMDNYHKRISVLEVSMMIVPLADNTSNHGRSNIKFQEASAHGLPVACQDLTPYKECPIRFTTGDQMIDQIRKTLKTEESFLKASRYGRSELDRQWLELDENIGLYKELYTHPYQDKNRKYLNELNATVS